MLIGLRDILFDGEANHHRHLRGWSYSSRTVNASGKLVGDHISFSEQKAQTKAPCVRPTLPTGAGDCAGMVRIAHGLRARIKVTPD